MADPENFVGGGGFEAKTSKIRMSSPKLRVIFRPKSEIQTFFSPKLRWSPEKKKKKKVFTKIETDISAEIGNSNVFSPEIRWSPKKKKGLHQNWDWFFGRNRKFKRFFRPKSGGLQKKKKKRFSPKLRLIFRPDSLRLGRWGGCIPKWSELFKIRADFSAKIVTFRLVGGDASPP